jgi:hypothetical protein
MESRFTLGLRGGYPPMLDFGPGERLISAA